MNKWVSLIAAAALTSGAKAQDGVEAPFEVMKATFDKNDIVLDTRLNNAMEQFRHAVEKKSPEVISQQSFRLLIEGQMYKKRYGEEAWNAKWGSVVDAYQEAVTKHLQFHPHLQNALMEHIIILSGIPREKLVR